MENSVSPRSAACSLFAIYEVRERKLFLARDRLGIKPLYVYSSGNRLVFASEIKTLLESRLVPRQLDPAGLRVFLQLRSHPSSLDRNPGSYFHSSQGTSASGTTGNGTPRPYLDPRPTRNCCASARTGLRTSWLMSCSMRCGNHLVSGRFPS